MNRLFILANSRLAPRSMRRKRRMAWGLTFPRRMGMMNTNGNPGRHGRGGFGNEARPGVLLHGFFFSDANERLSPAFKTGVLVLVNPG